MSSWPKGRTQPEQEFREIVNREGLKGLLFHEVWSSDGGGILTPGHFFHPS